MLLQQFKVLRERQAVLTKSFVKGCNEDSAIVLSDAEVDVCINMSSTITDILRALF